ncbi:MAG: amidohydrolase, partial [Anaerolineae bacterium]
MTIMLLTNGKIHTIDADRPIAGAVALRDGRIVAVGSGELASEFDGPGVERVDLEGRCVIPGLVDSHVHFRNFSLARRRVDLDYAGSLDEVLERIAAYAADDKNVERSGWLRGRGWAQGNWSSPRFPTAADLDRVVGRIPACMTHKSGHAVWVNSEALGMAGIKADTPNPPGGEIQRDEAGLPTGILLEDAMGLVTDLISPAAQEEVVDAMRDAQQYCWEVGLTGIHDFDGRSCFLALQELHRNDELHFRVV